MSISKISSELSSPLGHPELHLTMDVLVSSISTYIFQSLPDWVHDSNRPASDKITNEKDLNSQLCSYLDSNDKKPATIRFHHENPDQGKRSNDIGVQPAESYIFVAEQRYTIYDTIVSIECKRLPAPSPPNREKEYLTGNTTITTGGVQRFKTGDHGKRHLHAIMIGYVQKYDFKHWHTCINCWIKQLAGQTMSSGETWHETETLHMKDCQTEVARLESVNERIPGRSITNNIRIIHLWVAMIGGGIE